MAGAVGAAGAAGAGAGVETGTMTAGRGGSDGEEEEEEEEEEEDEGIELEEIIYKDVTYYKDNEGFIYKMDEEGQLLDTAVGYWKEKTKSIAFYK